MRMRALSLVFAAVLLGGVMAGCAGPRHAQYTATGAGIGAITGGILGGVIGSMSGRSAEGVVIGSILGGLMGASVGDAEYHQQRSEEAASQYYGYDTSRNRRDLVRIESVYAEPSVVAPGETVDLNIEYTVLTSLRSGTMVHEVREIKMGGDTIGRPETTVQRTGGTWVSTVPVTVPANAEIGTYKLTAIVETDEAGDVKDATFQVARGTGEGRWRR